MELKEKVTNSETKNENLEKNVESLTRQIQELRGSADRKLQNVTKQNAELRQKAENLKNQWELAEMKLKVKTELLEHNTLNVPRAPIGATILQNLWTLNNMVTPPSGEINIFQDLKSRLEPGQFTQKTDKNINFNFI